MNLIILKALQIVKKIIQRLIQNLHSLCESIKSDKEKKVSETSVSYLYNRLKKKNLCKQKLKRCFFIFKLMYLFMHHNFYKHSDIIFLQAEIQSI
jgi:hypothetical protein